MTIQCVLLPLVTARMTVEICIYEGDDEGWRLGGGWGGGVGWGGMGMGLGAGVQWDNFVQVQFRGPELYKEIEGSLWGEYSFFTDNVKVQFREPELYKEIEATI